MNHFQFRWTGLVIVVLAIGGCASSATNPTPDAVDPTDVEVTHTNHCSSAETTSCSDLGVYITNSSPHYSFTTSQSMTHGSIETAIAGTIEVSGSGYTTLGQSTRGPDGTITLHNATDDITLTLAVQQNYCLFGAGDVASTPATTIDTVSLSCTNYEGSYSNYSGCVACSIDTPGYKEATLQPQYRGESTGCPWQNGPSNQFQLCPPYVVYFDQAQRALQKLSVVDSLLQNAEGENFDTTFAPVVHSGKAAIFVMGFDGTIYASNKFYVGLFHHSTLYAGQPVAAAGELVVKDGVIKAMTNCSSHYLPSDDVTKQAIASLKQQGYTTAINYVSCSSSELFRDLDYKMVEK